MLSVFYKAASQQFMDIRLNASRTHNVRIIERPAMWMNETELNALVSSLRHIAGKTLPAGELGYGVLGGDIERLKHSIITLVTSKDNGTPVAFNALALMDVDLGHRSEEVLHLGLVMVDPDLRSQGLSWVLYGLTCVLMLFRNGLRPVWISSVTQVPSLVGLFSSGFSNVYPTPDQGPIRTRSLMHLFLAKTIMDKHRHVFGVGAEAGFDEDQFVITNAYTGGSDHLKKTFESAPKHRDDAVNSYCEVTLNYERGDDFLQLGQIDVATALSYIAREVPRKSFAALALAVGATILQRLAMPLWHWLDSSRDFGSLRAQEAPK